MDLDTESNFCEKSASDTFVVDFELHMPMIPQGSPAKASLFQRRVWESNLPNSLSMWWGSSNPELKREGRFAYLHIYWLLFSVRGLTAKPGRVAMSNWLASRTQSRRRRRSQETHHDAWTFPTCPLMDPRKCAEGTSAGEAGSRSTGEGVGPHAWWASGRLSVLKLWHFSGLKEWAIMQS